MLHKESKLSNFLVTFHRGGILFLSQVWFEQPSHDKIDTFDTVEQTSRSHSWCRGRSLVLSSKSSDFPPFWFWACITSQCLPNAFFLAGIIVLYTIIPLTNPGLNTPQCSKISWRDAAGPRKVANKYNYENRMSLLYKWSFWSNETANSSKICGNSRVLTMFSLYVLPFLSYPQHFILRSRSLSNIHDWNSSHEHI